MGSKEEVVYIIPVLRGDNQALPGVTHYLKSWEQKKKRWEQITTLDHCDVSVYQCSILLTVLTHQTLVSAQS